jgi:hypothetical protein
LRPLWSDSNNTHKRPEKHVIRHPFHPLYGVEVTVENKKANGVLIVRNTQGIGFGITADLCDEKACMGIEVREDAFCSIKSLIDLVELLEAVSNRPP